MTNLNQLKKHKTSDRIYILGSGGSILNITDLEWEEIKAHNSIGFNHWYVHDHEPTFYDLSYLANDYFEDEETNMFYLASKKCPNSKFILNHFLNPDNLNYFLDRTYGKVYINHFDFFDSQIPTLNNTPKDQLGDLAQYWSRDIFKHFNILPGDLLPNESFIYKSRGQLFATIQIAILLGYTDIRLVGVDLNSESKFQDSYKNAPYSSKSIGFGGEKFKPREGVAKDVKDPNGVHNTCQGTKDKDYLGIHKLLRIFKEKYLTPKSINLTVCNPNSLLVTENIKYQSIIGNLTMDKITFCIPSKTNLRYLKTCIPSIRKNSYRDDHEIIVFVDQDEDGTIEWLDSIKDEYNVSYYVNPDLGNSLYGIGRAYDYCVEKSTTDIFMIFHADMMLGKHADLKAFNHLKEKTVVCSTRIEPPIHPNGGEKILEDFGMWPEEFNEIEFDQYVNEYLKDDKTTEGIFAPWMMYKSEFLNILGGHDPIMHSCREDSDLFNRMQLAGFTFIQPWNSLVYHLTGRGAGSFDGDPERHKQWQADMNKSTLEFIRKWKSTVKHTPLMKPIITPRYKTNFRVHNNNIKLLEVLEPWCDTYYGDGAWVQYDYFIKENQNNTSTNLKEKIKPLEAELYDDFEGITVIIDGNTFTQQDYQFVQILSEVIEEGGEIGEFELGNMKIIINDLTTFEKDLIKI